MPINNQARSQEFFDLIASQNKDLRDHACRVADLATSLSLQLYPDNFDLLEKVAVGALFHDVGKTRMPIDILYKPAALSSTEIASVQGHSSVGAKMLAPLVEDLEVLQVVRNHHERWNGSGYPDGLAGDAIPLAARIVAVADTFDALTNNRVYRLAVSADEALEVLTDGSGALWDPHIVQALAAYLQRRTVAGRRGCV